MTFALASLFLPLAVAQDLERPDLPFRSIAGEDGAHVLYENVALLNFDRDPMTGFYFQSTGVEGLNAATLALTGAGVGAGFSVRVLPDDRVWSTISSGASIRLDDSLTFGTGIHWQIPGGADNNFVSWDLGLGWRPVPFLGLGATALNLGNPAPGLGVYSYYGGGLALRPAGDRLVLGADYFYSTPPDLAAQHDLVGSLKVRPIRGVWLRGFVEADLLGAQVAEYGGSVELRLTDVGFGVHGSAATAGGDPGVGAYAVSVRGDDHLISPGRTLASFELGEPLPYQPRSGLFSRPSESYLSFLRRIHDAAEDPLVKGLIFRVRDVPYSYAQIEELRGVVALARNNRKPVVAILGDGASTRAYFFAAACDRVYLHPAGTLDLVGVGAELQFFKGTLDLIGVEAQYAKRAEYKSAPERTTETGSTGPAREELEALLDDTYAALVEAVGRGRGRSDDEVKALIDGAPYTAKEALDKGLVDGLVYPDAIESVLKEAFKRGFSIEEEYGLDRDTSGWEPQRAIATVIVDGAITGGSSNPGGLFGGSSTGSDTVVEQLERAASARAVKAVVLRVDSPGGSSFASDEIWRAVERVKEEGKPVIVSMGGYAASGGYYVSAGADQIFALPTTVTGSIGVYGGKFNVAQLFDSLQVHTEWYQRGRNASMYSLARPFDEVEYAALDHLIAETYSQFKTRVGDGRGMAPDDVELIARGRVWSGVDAQGKGLVDTMGGFFDAVDAARAAAGMGARAPYTLVTFDSWGPPGTVPAVVIRMFQPKLKVPEALADLEALSRLQGERSFALMPYRLELF